MKGRFKSGSPKENTPFLGTSEQKHILETLRVLTVLKLQTAVNAILNAPPSSLPCTPQFNQLLSFYSSVASSHRCGEPGLSVFNDFHCARHPMPCKETVQNDGQLECLELQLMHGFLVAKQGQSFLRLFDLLAGKFSAVDSFALCHC